MRFQQLRLCWVTLILRHWKNTGKNIQIRTKSPQEVAVLLMTLANRKKQATLKKMANRVLVSHLLETEGGLGEVGIFGNGKDKPKMDGYIK